ncbi:MAG: XRE family transcriptional regulator [Planctomycetota bacterium]
MQTVGSLIRAQRRSLDLSLRALASRAGCTPGYLSEIENEKRASPPSAELLARIEDALELAPGTLRDAAMWQTTPGQVKRRLHNIEAREQRTRDALRNMMGSGALDDAYEAGVLRELFGDPDTHERVSVASANVDAVRADLPVQIPLINSVQAGYPREFTDLGYPVRIADEYIAVPGVSDPDAFAARVVGDSMAPDYREGDIVVFSPTAETREGGDCFARFERDDETTFKRVFFETDDSGRALIRLQPVNPKYRAVVVEREAVAGLFAAVYVVRRLGA